jgi:hypothetical protein
LLRLLHGLIMAFYKRSRPSAEYGTLYSGYDHADTIDDVIIAYRRTRTLKHFILTDGSPDLATIRCSCGNLLSEPVRGDTKADPGNRCQFRKRAGKPEVLGQHYACSWGTLFGAIGTSDTLAEAGAKLAVAEAGGWLAVTAG